MAGDWTSTARRMADRSELSAVRSPGVDGDLVALLPLDADFSAEFEVAVRREADRRGYVVDVASEEQFLRECI